MLANNIYVCITIHYKSTELFITNKMPMYFELTRPEIRATLRNTNVGQECQFDVAEKLRVRQTISDLHAYTDLRFETSTKNKQLPDKLLVRRIK